MRDQSNVLLNTFEFRLGLGPNTWYTFGRERHLWSRTLRVK